MVLVLMLITATLGPVLTQYVAPYMLERFSREGSYERMNGSTQTIRDESRWPPALTLFRRSSCWGCSPSHVTALPVWVYYLTLVAVLLPMAAVALTKGNTVWLGIERTMIILLAAAYVANTIAELADMIGVITLTRRANNAFSLLSSSVAIWVANVLTFSLLYWEIDQGGPTLGRASRAQSRIGSFRNRRNRKTCHPTGGRCSSIIYILDTTRRRLSAPPMPCRLRVAPRC